MSVLFQSDELFFVLQIRVTPFSKWTFHSCYTTFEEAEKSAKKFLRERSGIQLRIIDTEEFSEQKDLMRDWYSTTLHA